MNWISPTGLSPCAAMPTHKPLISSSASGVSTTRSAPKRCCNPAVARNTPPFTPTSSPSTTTLSSSAMARPSARFTASTSVSSVMRLLLQLQLLPLGGIDLREFRIEVIEHGRGGARGGRQIALDRCFDLLLAFRDEPLLVGFAPELSADELRPQPRL